MDTPRASAKKSQIRRTQFRAKRGAEANEAVERSTGAKTEVPAAENPINTATGTGDKFCSSEPTRTGVAGIGLFESEFSEQQAILPPQWQHAFAGVAQVEAASAGNCPSSSTSAHPMATMTFTKILSPNFSKVEAPELAETNHFLSAGSAARIFATYFSGSLSNFFLQLLQHRFTS